MHHQGPVAQNFLPEFFYGKNQETPAKKKLSIAICIEILPEVFFYGQKKSLAKSFMQRGPGVDELIRFWARFAKGQRSMNLICYFYLVNTKPQEPLGGFSSNLVQRCTTRSR